jgi:hypothetical protein
MAQDPQISADELARAMAQLARERAALDSSFGNFTSVLSDSINELGRGNNGIQEVTKSFRSLNSIASKFKYDQEGISRLSKKEIENNITRIKQDKSRLTLAIEKGHVTGNELIEAQGVLGLTNELIAAAETRLDKEKEILSKIGLYGNAIKGISKIPILGGMIDSEAVLNRMYDTAEGGGSKFKVLGEGLKATASEFGKSLTNPEAALLYIAQQTLIADENTTKLAKSLNQTKTEAAGTQIELSGMAMASGNAFLNTSKLVEATVKLGQQLGIAKVFSADVTTEFALLTGRMGLAEESAAGLAKMSIMLGKNSHNVTTEALGTAQALQSQAGIQLDNKKILEESGKVSGQLLANFKGNPTAIAAAVTQAKLLGTTLEQTKKQSESLLDFQSSIENELKAELITGQQLNLERARALALSGDQAGVAKELASQNMNFSKFSQMNVLAQKDFAAAVGLSADELSDQLATQQFIGKSRSEVAAVAGEEVANRLQALSVQERFTASMQKLQDALTPVLTALAFVLDKTVRLVTLDFKGLVGADDLMSGYGNRTLSTPQGTYALNNNDTVIAGTNLFRGNDVYSGPAGALSLGGGGAVVDAIAKLGDRIDQLSERPVIARPSEFATPITIKQQQNIRRSI